MLKSLNIVRLARNFSSPITRSVTNFADLMEEAVEARVERNKEKSRESFKNRKERYNGKIKRRDWTPETDEAKKARLELNGEVDRVKRRKSLILLGYSGVNYSGMQRNPDVPTIEEELLKAMLKHGWINEEGYKLPQQAFFQRAARTDKGVSAARQVVSVKLPEVCDVEAINKDLPSDIRVFAVKRVTKGFNSKSTCDARSYSYTLPTYTFTKDGEEYQDTSFRLSSERLEQLNQTLALYLGTKNFHNFTVKKEHFDPSAKRFIISFECEKPFVPENTEVEFARLRITGQSFMLHQIRRMVGMVIAVMRGYAQPDFITKAFEKEKFLMPQAPGLGLVLDNVHYTRYNERYGADGVHESLLFEDENEAVEDFFSKNIMPVIIETELRETSMRHWISARLRDHSYDIQDKEIEEADKDEYDSD